MTANDLHNAAGKAMMRRAHLKHWVDERVPEYMPDNSLDRRVSQARAEMGEARWAELNREWQ